MPLKFIKPPYASTEVPADKTQQQITTLLRRYGISRIVWDANYDFDQVKLDFVIEYEKEDQMHRIAVRVIPPMFVATHRTYSKTAGKHIKEEAANWAQSMRLLLYWIKAKMEAVAYGLNTVEKEFLSDIVTTLPDGSQRTIWDMISQQIDSQKLSLEYRGGM